MLKQGNIYGEPKDITLGVVEVPIEKQISIDKASTKGMKSEVYINKSESKVDKLRKLRSVIKPVTNKDTLNKSEVNRGEQTSFRTEKGNARVVIKKGGSRGKNYSIGLKDIDTAVISHMINIMKPKVKEANEIIKVPVLYGNEERWKSVRGRGTLRDRNVTGNIASNCNKRTDLSFDENLKQSFKHDLRGDHINVIKLNR